MYYFDNHVKGTVSDIDFVAFVEKRSYGFNLP